MARPQRGARTQDRRRGQTAGPSQLPRGLIRNPYPPMTILSDDEVEAIHHASLQILRDIGVNFLLPEARDLLAGAGAEVDGPRVRFDPAMVAEKFHHHPAGLSPARPQSGPVGGFWRQPHCHCGGRQPTQRQ